MPPFYSCTKCVDSPGIIHYHTPDCHPVSWAWMLPQVPADLTTERRFDSQGTWDIDVPGLIFDIPSRGVCTTRHWQKSGRLVQDINVCMCSALPFFSVLSSWFSPFSSSTPARTCACKPKCRCHKWGTGTLTPFICVFVHFVYVFDCIILYCLLTRSYGCENTDT